MTNPSKKSHLIGRASKVSTPSMSERVMLVPIFYFIKNQSPALRFLLFCKSHAWLTCSAKTSLQWLTVTINFLWTRAFDSHRQPAENFFFMRLRHNRTIRYCLKDPDFIFAYSHRQEGNLPRASRLHKQNDHLSAHFVMKSIRLLVFCISQIKSIITIIYCFTIAGISIYLAVLWIFC